MITIFKNNKEAARRGGKRTQQVFAERRMSNPIGPRSRPTGKLLKVVTVYDPNTGEFNRYDLYKSLGGRRRIDLHHNRDRWIRLKSATWFCKRLLSHIAMLAEIVED